MQNDKIHNRFYFPYDSNPPKNCACGKEHLKAPTEIIYGDAVAALTELIRINNYRNILLVADKNTFPLAGERLMSIRGDNVSIRSFIYNEDHLVPNETAVGSLLLQTNDSEKRLLVALGSGTLNDLTRYICFRLRIPYIIIATAPSMDGYASSVSPLIVSGLKTTYQATVPQYIICDPELIKTAPDILVSAGVGDAMKYSCLCDWRLSALINGEYYCDFISGLTESAINDCVSSVGEIREKSAEGLMKLLNALLLSGVAMSYSGNSRPASGAEHHIAHFLEMQFLFDGKIPPPHGTLVGIGALTVAKIHEMLINHLTVMSDADFEKNSNIKDDFEFYAAEMHRVYRTGAEAIIQEELSAGRRGKKRERVETYAAKRDEIIGIIKQNTAEYGRLREIIMAVGGETSPERLSIEKATFIDSVIYAKEMRQRFTVLQIADDLNLLRNYAAEISEFFYTRK